MAAKPSRVRTQQAIERTGKRILELKQELALLRQKLPPLPVQDYTFLTPEGKKLKLAAAFGKHEDLIVIHNMGIGCPYCSLWADGFNSIFTHLQERAGFLLTSPDAPKIQAATRKQRGWKFPMASVAETTFAHDLGFEPNPGQFWPGVSTLHQRSGGRIEHIASTVFGPGDDFCSVWHFLDLLAGGAKGWEPRSS